MPWDGDVDAGGARAGDRRRHSRLGRLVQRAAPGEPPGPRHRPAGRWPGPGDPHRGSAGVSCRSGFRAGAGVAPRAPAPHARRRRARRGGQSLSAAGGTEASPCAARSTASSPRHASRPASSSPSTDQDVAPALHAILAYACVRCEQRPTPPPDPESFLRWPSRLLSPIYRPAYFPALLDRAISGSASTSTPLAILTSVEKARSSAAKAILSSSAGAGPHVTRTIWLSGSAKLRRIDFR